MSNATLKSPRAAVAPRQRSWRLTTASRVFALAVITGHLLSTRTIGTLGVVLVALVILAAAACLLELGDRGRRVHALVPIGEGIVAAALVAQAVGAIQPLLLYLAVPTLAAGLARGPISTVNTFLATGFSLGAVWTMVHPVTQIGWLPTALTWLAVGLGTGLLAAWYSRALRRLEDGQAPYAAAHRLLTQLHTLTGRHRLGLDSRASADEFLTRLQAETDSDEGALVVDLPGAEFRTGLLATGQTVLLDCLDSGSTQHSAEVTAWPLRVADRPFGAVALHRWDRPWTKRELDRTQELVDEAALRLETALVFEQVRDVATSEERGRVAREIHDGIAQEVAGLGYRLDELAADASDAATRAHARELRAEVSRVVGELRLSILDLRLDARDTDFTSALSNYAREIGARSGLHVELRLECEDGFGPDKTATPELLRIVQEAIGNVRRHAHATTIFLTYTGDRRGFRLDVADNGIGSAHARAGHYGLATMRERAERLGLFLNIGDRPGGGTFVRVTSDPALIEHLSPEHPPPREESHVYDRAARR